MDVCVVGNSVSSHSSPRLTHWRRMRSYSDITRQSIYPKAKKKQIWKWHHYGFRIKLCFFFLFFFLPLLLAKFLDVFLKRNFFYLTDVSKRKCRRLLLSRSTGRHFDGWSYYTTARHLVTKMSSSFRECWQFSANGKTWGEIKWRPWAAGARTHLARTSPPHSATHRWWWNNSCDANTGDDNNKT